jgi:hypothetical protein
MSKNLDYKKKISLFSFWSPTANCRTDGTGSTMFRYKSRGSTLLHNRQGTKLFTHLTQHPTFHGTVPARQSLTSRCIADHVHYQYQSIAQ